MSRILRGGLVTFVVSGAFVVAACGAASSSGGVAGTTSSPAASTSPAASASAATSASPGGSGLNQAMIQFTPIAGGSITGGAILTDLGDGTTAVTIGVVAAGVTEPMPAELKPGSCSESGGASASPGASGGAAGSASPAASAPASMAASPAASASGAAPSGNGAVAAGPNGEYKLTDLTAGASNTVIATGLDALTSSPYAIQIHQSAADQTVVACADVTR